MNRSTAERVGPVRRAAAITRFRQRNTAVSDRARPQPDWEAYARLCCVLVEGERARENE